MILDTLVIVFFLLMIIFFIGAGACKKGSTPWLAKDAKTSSRRSFWLGIISLIVFIVLLVIQLPHWV